MAVALAGSLTKLGVNGGLVASAGFSLPFAGRQAGPRHRNRPQADNMHTASGNPVDVENTSSQAAAGAVNVPLLHPHRFRTCVKGWKRSVYNFQESN